MLSIYLCMYVSIYISISICISIYLSIYLSTYIPNNLYIVHNITYRNLNYGKLNALIKR